MVFPHPFEKYARQIGSNPQGSGWKLTKIFELPPSSLRWSLLLGGRVFQGVSTLDFPMIFVPSVLSPAGRFGTPGSPECQSDSSPSQRTNLGQQQRLPTPTCFLCEDLRWHHNIRWISGETKTYKQKNSKHFTETGGLAPWGKNHFINPWWTHQLKTQTTNVIWYQHTHSYHHLWSTKNHPESEIMVKSSGFAFTNQPTPGILWGGVRFPLNSRSCTSNAKLTLMFWPQRWWLSQRKVTRSCFSKKSPSKGPSCILRFLIECLYGRFRK